MLSSFFALQKRKPDGSRQNIIGGGGIHEESRFGSLGSAEQVTERVQTLTYGTQITQAGQTTKLYRDSAGRTRMEYIFMPPPGTAVVARPAFIQIVDPMAAIATYSIRAVRPPAVLP
jgi:hypothetical protein